MIELKNNLINYSRQSITEDDILEMSEVLRSNFITQGKKIEEFEKAICNYTGAKYCVVISSGTAGLDLSVKVLKNEYTKRVITTPNSFVATANCALMNKLELEFTDIYNDTHNINADSLEKNQNIIYIPVHFAGNQCDMETFQEFRKENCFIIEDACHSLGGNYKDGSKVGNCKYSDLTVFSFHPAKNITTGEGGAITTNNEEYYKKLKALLNHGRINGEMIYLGNNYRMTDFQAALGISQLKKLDMFILKRQAIYQRYNREFNGMKYIKIPYLSKFSACNLYVLEIDFEELGKSRDQVRNELLKLGINTQIHYKPIYKNGFYGCIFNRQLPNTEEYYKKCLTLPLYPLMTSEQVNKVIEAVKEVIR